MFLTLTVAPCTAAPVGSFIVPSSAALPDSDCANADMPRKKMPISTRDNDFLMMLGFMLTPTFLTRCKTVIGSRAQLMAGNGYDCGSIRNRPGKRSKIFG